MIKNAILEVELWGWVMFIFSHLLGVGHQNFVPLRGGGSCSFNPRSLEGGGQLDPPSIFLALNFCSWTDCQKLWHNCSLFVNTSFNTN